MQRCPFLFVGGMGAILLAACTPAASSPPIAPQVAAKPAVRGSEFNCTPDQEWWRASGPPKRGGVFTYGANASRFDNLDPTAGGSVPDLARVYETLLRKRGCWDDDVEVASRLAKSWQVSSDGLTWTLELRDDVKWHNIPPLNGRAFTSADVAWSIDWHKQKGISGGYWRDVTPETPGPHTVVLRLKQPNVDFPNVIGEQTNVMLPHVVIDQLQSRLYDLMPFVPTVTRVWDNMWSCRTKNLSPHSYGWPGLEVGWIDETGC